MLPQHYFKGRLYPLAVQLIRIQFCIDKIDWSRKINSFSDDEEGQNPFKMKFVIMEPFKWSRKQPH